MWELDYKESWVLKNWCFWTVVLKKTLFFFLIFLISWRLITLQYCSGFCHTLKWISHGFTCIPHPDLPSHLPLHPVPLESPLDCKETQPVHPKGDQSWVFLGRTDAEAETLILWPPDAKSWLIWKDPDAGKDWGQEEKGMTEDEMVGWYHQLNGHGFV